MKRAGIKPSTVTFNSLLDTCVRNNRMQDAWSVMDHLASEVSCDNFTYSTLIKGITSPSHASDLDKIFALLNKISSLKGEKNASDSDKKESFKPDEILINVLLDACINCN